MKVDYAAIGQRVKAKRRALGRTQEWLAEQIHVSVGYVSQVERGVTRINLDTLAEIAAALGCGLEELVVGVSSGDRGYLNGELAQTLARMNAKQRSMLLEMAELILNF